MISRPAAARSVISLPSPSPQSLDSPVDRSGIALTAKPEMNDCFNGKRLMPRRHSSLRSLRADDIECLLKAENWLDILREGDKSSRSLRAPSHLDAPFSGPDIQRLEVNVRSGSIVLKRPLKRHCRPDSLVAILTINCNATFAARDAIALASVI